MSKTVWKQAAIFSGTQSFDFTPGVDFDQLLLRFTPITSAANHTQVSFSGTQDVVFDVFTVDEGTVGTDGVTRTHSVMQPRAAAGNQGAVRLKANSGVLFRDTDELVLTNIRTPTVTVECTDFDNMGSNVVLVTAKAFSSVKEFTENNEVIANADVGTAT